MIKTNNLNLLLFGCSGTGKTTLINALIKEYYNGECSSEHILYINTLKEQGIQYYRTELKTFCQTKSDKKQRYKAITECKMCVVRHFASDNTISARGQ